jgi:hypothetical protein
MRYVERFEYKYQLDYQTYLAFRNKISMFMAQDNYTEIAKSKRYFVRSLYYDTYDYKHYKESEEGQFGRIKCRIRTYEEIKGKADIISIEIKTKQGSGTKKFSQLIPIDAYQFFLDHGYFNQSSHVLDEFTRLMYLGPLEPKLVVEYEREGYHPMDGSDFRLTFDFDVRSGLSSDLFDKNLIHTRIHNKAIICEIKCGMEKPDWLQSLIKEYGLKVVGNSKYVQAVQRIHPIFIHGREYLENRTQE